MNQAPKKKDRSGPLAGAAVAACFVSAYGFNNQSALFTWVLPIALVGLTALWSHWPRRSEEQSPRLGA
jgi:hypothetical protein